MHHILYSSSRITLMSNTIKHRIEQDNLAVNIVLTPAEQGWQMMIADDEGIATAWEDAFNTKEEALAEAKAAIAEHGIKFFIGNGY